MPIGSVSGIGAANKKSNIELPDITFDETTGTIIIADGNENAIDLRVNEDDGYLERW